MPRPCDSAELSISSSPPNNQSTPCQCSPTPLYRARRLEKLLDTPARIYYKVRGQLAWG